MHMGTGRSAADAQRQRRHERYAQRISVGGTLVAPVPECYHGKPSTYQNWGCRCDLCREASSQASGRSASARADRRRALSTLVTAREPQPEPPVPEQRAPDPSDGLLSDPLPEFNPGARAEITTVEQLRGVLDAYYRPQLRLPALAEDCERRIAGPHAVTVNLDTGVIVFVGEAEQSSAAPESLQEAKAPKRRRSGGAGNRNPTSVGEIIDRLKDIGATVKLAGKHYRVHLPNGEAVSLPCTPSDHRWIANKVAEIAVKGYDVRRF